MKSFKKLITLVTLTLATSKTASGAPIPDQALDPTGQVIDGTLSAPSISSLQRLRSITKIWNRSLADIVKPVLTSAQGLTDGVNKGVEGGAGDIDQGLHRVGSAVSSITSGVGSIAQGTVQGLGNTVANTPQALNGLMDALEHGGGPVGNLLGALFG